MGKIKVLFFYNVMVVKGSVYGIFSRSFVEFVLRNLKVRDILKWIEDIFSLDEIFWVIFVFNKELGVLGI